MSVSKLKNLILLVLTICALSLLAIAIPNRLSQTHEQRRMLSALKTLYDGYDLSIEISDLPDSATLYSVELSDAGIQTAAQALLGAKAAPAGGEDRFESVYTSELGTLTAARSGAFSAELTGAAHVKNHEKSAEKLLRNMGYQVQQLQQEKPADGTIVLTASQSLLGVPIFGGSLTLAYADDCLVQIKGTFYTGSESITRVSEQQSITAADALTQLLAGRDALGWVGSSVTGLTQGYLPADSAGGGIRLVPVWLIETDTGNFFVNGITREVTAA